MSTAAGVAKLLDHVVDNQIPHLGLDGRGRGTVEVDGHNEASRSWTVVDGVDSLQIGLLRYVITLTYMAD